MSEPVNLFTITSFFKDDPNMVKKGLNSVDSGRIISVKISDDGMMAARVKASMKNKVYDVQVCKVKYLNFFDNNMHNINNYVAI